MTTYTATRLEEHFYRYVTALSDGTLAPSDDPDDFNVNRDTHYSVVEEYVFDTVSELVAALRRDYVSLSAYGDGSLRTAVDPDGSHTIDYRTGEECAITWTLPDSLSEGLVERVIVPSVDK